jgi:hypothetical protein
MPEPMLAELGPLPTRGGWAFQPKWDGFHAIVRSLRKGHGCFQGGVHGYERFARVDGRRS